MLFSYLQQTVLMTCLQRLYCIFLTMYLNIDVKGVSGIVEHEAECYKEFKRLFSIQITTSLFLLLSLVILQRKATFFREKALINPGGHHLSSSKWHADTRRVELVNVIERLAESQISLRKREIPKTELRDGEYWTFTH